MMVDTKFTIEELDETSMGLIEDEDQALFDDFVDNFEEQP
jgi:hypothetical protein